VAVNRGEGAHRRRLPSGVAPAAITAVVLLLAVAVWPFLSAINDPGGAPAGGSSKGWTDVAAEDFAAVLERDEVVVINVHVPYEGELPGTDLFLPYHEIEEHLDRLPDDLDTPLAVYCRTARMSEQAVGELAELGYTRIFHLAGGFEAWQAAGYELLHVPRRS
jgi:rhodanese-related sulfurtransferase